MYQICICDDEAIHREKLENSLMEYSFITGREFHIDKYEMPWQLYDAAAKYDVIFLDIDFPEAEPGIEAGKKLRAIGIQSIIMFQTSYPQYMMEGYEAEAFRYILKPITLEKITVAMDAVFAKWEHTTTFVSIRILGGTVLLDSSRIRMVVTEGRKQKIHYDSDVIETWEPLKDIFPKLPDDFFAYAHQGCIVNLAQVQQLQGNDVILTGDAKAALSRRMKKTFIFSLDKMLEQGK